MMNERKSYKKRIIIFGYIRMEEEYSRSYQMINALRNSGCELHWCTSNIGKIDSRRNSIEKIIYSIALTPIHWLELIINFSSMPKNTPIYVPYPAHIDALLALVVARLFRRRLMLDWFFGLHETIVEDRRLISTNNILSKIIKGYECLILNQADVVFMDTAEHCVYLTGLGANQCHLDWIPVGINEEIWKYNIPNNNSAAENAELSVLFWGTFIPLHGVDIIIKAAEILKTESIKITLIGTGQLSTDIKALIAKLKIQNINYIDKFISMKELNAMAREADVILGIFSDTPKAKRVIPYKVHQAMAMGKPIITASSKAICQVLTDSESAMLIPANNPDELAKTINKLRLDSNLRQVLSVGSRSSYVKNLSNCAITERMRTIIEKQYE